MGNLIRNVFLDSSNASKEIGDNQLCEHGLLPDCPYQGVPLHPGDRGLMNCCRGARPQRPARETALAKQITLPEDRKDGSFASLGRNRQLHVAILDVEHGISRIALLEDGLVVSVLPRGCLAADCL
jgi:hypothetical protein